MASSSMGYPFVFWAFSKKVADLWRFNLVGADSVKFSAPLAAKLYVECVVLKMQQWYSAKNGGAWSSCAAGDEKVLCTFVWPSRFDTVDFMLTTSQ